MTLSLDFISNRLVETLALSLRPALSEGWRWLWAPVLAFVLVSSWNFGCQVCRLLGEEIRRPNSPQPPVNPYRRPPCS